MRLDLGCGPRKVPGTIGVDYRPAAGVDLIADLDAPLPFRDDAIDEIHALHVLEHVSRPLDLLDEIHRILRPGGLLVAEVPHHSNPYAHSDPTHRTQWGLYSFAYLTSIEDQPFRRKVPGTYVSRRFSIADVQMVPMDRSRWSPLRALDLWIDSSMSRMEHWERHFSKVYPMYAVRAQLRKPGPEEPASVT